VDPRRGHTIHRVTSPPLAPLVTFGSTHTFSLSL
jgi:hypothetical protein